MSQALLITNRHQIKDLSVFFYSKTNSFWGTETGRSTLSTRWHSGESNSSSDSERPVNERSVSQSNRTQKNDKFLIHPDKQIASMFFSEHERTSMSKNNLLLLLLFPVKQCTHKSMNIMVGNRQPRIHRNQFI